MKRTIGAIIRRAERLGRIKDGLVLCDNCNTPASMDLSLRMSWTCCAPCVWGESYSFDPDDLIRVESNAKPRI